jgi:hypothetical protein
MGIEPTSRCLQSNIAMPWNIYPLVRTDRIELSTSVWKTVILPLNYTRKLSNSGSGGTRTLTPRFKRPVLYQLSHEPSDFVFSTQYTGLLSDIKLHICLIIN